MRRLGVFALIGLLIATSVAVGAESDERGKGDGSPAEERHDVVGRVLVGGREKVGRRESESAVGEWAAVEKSAPLAAAESVETTVVMTRFANEGEEELGPQEGQEAALWEPIPVTSYKYHTVVRPDPDVAAELLSYITSPPPTTSATPGKKRRKRKRKGDGKLRNEAVAERRAHIDERTFSDLGSLFVGKNSRPSRENIAGSGGSYHQPLNEVTGNVLRATRRPQRQPDEAYGSPQGTFRGNPDAGSAQVASIAYGSTQSPVHYRVTQATADSYGSPQGPVHQGPIYQDQVQQAPDSYGSPHSPIRQSSDSYGAPLGGVVTHQAHDGYGVPQGGVIHSGGGAPEFQPQNTGHDAPAQHPPPQDGSHRPPARRPQGGNTRRPGRGVMRYLRGAMRGARDSLDSMGDSVLSSMRRLAKRLRGAGREGGGSGGGGGGKGTQGNPQEHQHRPNRPRPPSLQLPQLDLPRLRLPQLSLPTQLPPLKLPQIPQIRLPQIKLPRPQLPEFPQIKLPRPQLPEIKLPRPLSQIQLPRPIFRLPNLNFPRPGKKRPGGGDAGGTYQHSQDNQNPRPESPGQHGGYPQSQVTCGTSPATTQYGGSSPKLIGDEDRYEAAAAAAVGALDAGYGGNPFLRAERNTVDSRERDMRRLREAWLLYRGAMLSYEQKYNVDDPALVRFKKEVLSSQALGFSAAGFPFETVGIPKLVEENGEQGFARAQAKRDNVIIAPGQNQVRAHHNPKGPLPTDAGLLGPGYSFMLYPREAQYHREARRRQSATSRNDAPVSAVDVLNREAEEDDLHNPATADPFDITLSPENVSKLSKYEKILTPLLFGGSSVAKRRGHRRMAGLNDGAAGEESAKTEVDEAHQKP